MGLRARLCRWYLVGLKDRSGSKQTEQHSFHFERGCSPHQTSGGGSEQAKTELSFRGLRGTLSAVKQKARAKSAHPQKPRAMLRAAEAGVKTAQNTYTALMRAVDARDAKKKP